MDKYLLQLRSDIRLSASAAPVSVAVDSQIQWDDEAAFYENSHPKMALPVLFGISIEAFPPKAFLTDHQMEALVGELNQLWRAFRLSWDMPSGLTIGQQYSAMLRAMKEESISWQNTTGGIVKICHFESNGYCPHGQPANCYCKKVHEAAQLDLAVWEEHVRSQGIDPYQELTEEAGAAFQAESKRRSLLKRSREEWPDLWQDEAFKRLDSDPSNASNKFTKLEEPDELFGFFVSEDGDVDKHD